MAEEWNPRADASWQKTLEKYPSLKKFDELGDEYPEWNDGREEKVLEYIKSHPDFAQMKGNPQSILDAMDDFAGKEHFLISIGPHKSKVIDEIMTAERPKVLVEMGGYLGYSAIFFADIMRRQAAAGEHIMVWSLEFEARFADIATECVALAGLSDFVTVVTGPADESLRRLKIDGKLDHVDLLFLDHVEDLYEQDLKVAMGELKLLKKDAVVLADNVVRPGAPKYREYVRSHAGLSSRGVLGLIVPGEFEDEIEVTKVL